MYENKVLEKHKIINKGFEVIKKVLMILGIGFFVTGCSVKPAKIAYNEPAKNQRLSVYSVIFS